MQNVENLAYDNMANNSSVISYAPELVYSQIKMKLLYAFFKRLFDIFFSTILLVILSPVFLLTAIAIKLDTKGSAFFAHERIGINRKIIKILKFRSMVADAEQLLQNFTEEQKSEFKENYKLENDTRITKVGKFIRKFSLDELPQLFNILINDLSFVGPRPVIDNELDKYGYRKYDFLSIKPGLTGYWQVNGRSTTTYEKRMEMELYYIENRSLWLDFKIILKTIPVVLIGKGAK